MGTALEIDPQGRGRRGDQPVGQRGYARNYRRVHMGGGARRGSGGGWTLAARSGGDATVRATTDEEEDRQHWAGGRLAAASMQAVTSTATRARWKQRGEFFGWSSVSPTGMNSEKRIQGLTNLRDLISNLLECIF